MVNRSVEQAHAEARELAHLLKQELRERRGKATVLSRELGYAAEYMGRVFAGGIDLKFVDLFGALAWLGLHPRSFFSRHYPLASGAVPSSGPVAGVLLEVQALLARAAGPSQAPEPEAITQRAVGLLRGLMARADKTRRAAATKLGLTEMALGEVLRGRTKLTAWHVFALLHVTGTSPRLFFHELLAVSDAERPLPGEAVGELTALVERAMKAFSPETPPPKALPLEFPPPPKVKPEKRRR